MVSDGMTSPWRASSTIRARWVRFGRPEGSGSAQLDPGRLDLGKLVEGVQRLVTADARLLVTAERRGDVAAVVGVDPYRAGAQALGELEGLVDVRREDRRAHA